MNIQNAILKSFNSLQEEFHVEYKQNLYAKNFHSHVSQKWIEFLASNLKAIAGSEAIAFYKGNNQNQKDFKINEYLHDVLICEVDVIKSPKHKSDIYFIKNVEWQVESELLSARDTRELLKDFNKLILGSAKNKLFVFSNILSNENEDLLDFFETPASVCNGNLFVAIIPHPKDLFNDSVLINVYKFCGKWKLTN